MSYHRILPRDAFNEAKLLKCVGKITLLIEDGTAPGWSFDYDGEPFNIQQDDSDGSISVSNIAFYFNGESVRLSTPLNARDNWPMIADDDLEPIFTEQGELVDR